MEVPEPAPLPPVPEPEAQVEVEEPVPLPAPAASNASEEARIVPAPEVSKEATSSEDDPQPSLPRPLPSSAQSPGLPKVTLPDGSVEGEDSVRRSLHDAFSRESSSELIVLSDSEGMPSPPPLVPAAQRYHPYDPENEDSQLPLGMSPKHIPAAGNGDGGVGCVTGLRW